jgi:hypothetical protein
MPQQKIVQALTGTLLADIDQAYSGFTRSRRVSSFSAYNVIYWHLAVVSD